MRTAALVILVVAVLAFARVEGQEESAAPQALSLEILESANRVSVDAEPGVWRILTEEERKEVRRQVGAGPGAEASLRTAGMRPGREAGQSLTVLERVDYVRDFETHDDGSEPDPIMATIRQGVIADLWTKEPTTDDTVNLEVRVTVASLIRPIPTFQTMLGGRQVTIELPELRITRQRTETRLGAGSSALLALGNAPAGREAPGYLYLLLTVESGTAPPDPLRPR